MTSLPSEVGPVVVTPYSFKEVESLKFFLVFNVKVNSFSVRVSDEKGNVLAWCIGSGESPEKAKAEAIKNLSKAIFFIALAEKEAA